MIKRTSAGVVAGLLLTAMSANGAIVSGTFNVTDAQLPVLYSGTLDSPCTPNGGTPGTPGAGFFFCSSSSIAPVAIAITPSSGGGGTIQLNYDDATGEVTEITSFDIFTSDMVIEIASFVSGTVTVVGGNGVPGANDLPVVNAGLAGVNGTADADQNPGDINSFQHDAPGIETDATGFATFSDIVDTCVGDACALIPVLNINALRYEIVGIVSGGQFNGALRAETSNNSNYLVDFTSTIAPIPVPAAAWLFGSALGLLGWMRRRAA